MATPHNLMRAPHLMTATERNELLDAGWQIEVVDALQLRGFCPCKPDYVAARFEGLSMSRTMGFLRQTATPHLYITVAMDDEVHVVLECIDTAIYEQGRRRGHESLAGLFMRFFDQCKAWPSAPDNAALEKRLAALEAKTVNQSAQ